MASLTIAYRHPRAHSLYLINPGNSHFDSITPKHEIEESEIIIRALSQEEHASSTPGEGMGRSRYDNTKPAKKTPSEKPSVDCSCEKCRVPTKWDSFKNILSAISYIGLFKALCSIGLYIWDLGSTLWDLGSTILISILTYLY